MDDNATVDFEGHIKITENVYAHFENEHITGTHIHSRGSKIVVQVDTDDEGSFFRTYIPINDLKRIIEENEKKEAKK